MEHILEKHRDFLVDRIDLEFGLLDKLRAAFILTKEDANKIKLPYNTPEDKNRILLDIILKNKKANELISALGDIGQTHLVNFLNADGEYKPAYGDDWPLSESNIKHLDANRESLMELLDTSDLCIRLYSGKVINYRQKQLIFSKPTDADKNDALLDIITKFSLLQYKMTITCLNDSNQSHTVELLSLGGVAVRVHANFEGTVENVDELEEVIITRFRNRPMEEAAQFLELTRLKLIAVKKGQSIVLYIHCTTHCELLQLIDQLKTDTLKELIGKVFTEMLSMEGTLRVTLTWSLDEFRRAAEYLEGVWKKFPRKKRVSDVDEIMETNPPQGIEESPDECDLEVHIDPLANVDNGSIGRISFDFKDWNNGNLTNIPETPLKHLGILCENGGNEEFWDLKEKLVQHQKKSKILIEQQREHERLIEWPDKYDLRYTPYDDIGRIFHGFEVLHENRLIDWDAKSLKSLGKIGKNRRFDASTQTDEDLFKEKIAVSSDEYDQGSSTDDDLGVMSRAVQGSCKRLVSSEHAVTVKLRRERKSDEVQTIKGNSVKEIVKAILGFAILWQKLVYYERPKLRHRSV